MGDSRRSMKPHAEKPTFTQTCNLLSQFMKEKLLAMDSANKAGVPSKLENNKAKGMNLLTSKESPDGASKDIAAVLKCLPQYIQNASNSNGSDSSGKDQLTIFYCGKVLVFNDFPAENATEIMEMATKLSSNTSTMKKVNENSIAAVPPPELNKKVAVPANINSSEQQCPPSASQPNGSNRIARRASLHRFFEKRKERVTARGPYPLNNPLTASGSKPAEESSAGAAYTHHDQGPSSKELDLKL